MILGFNGASNNLLVGEVYGIRRWNIGYNHKLQSLTEHYIWEPGENISGCYYTSKCKCKYEHCGCGFWSYHGKHARFGDGGIVGVVANYGDITVGKKGYRSEKSRIVALYWKRHRVIPTIAAGAEIIVYSWIFALAVTGVLSIFIGVATLSFFAPIFILGACSQIICMSRGWEPKGNKGAVLDEFKINQIKANYPDVEIFTSYRKMLKKYPIKSGRKIATKL